MDHQSSPSVALVGFGRWGRNIGRVLARLGALKLIVDPAAAALKPVADELGVPIVTDLDAAFAPDIAAVAIAAPAVDHARLAQRAMEAGKPVFVEKPLALELADADTLASLSARSGVSLMVGHLLQYHPAFVTLKAMVAAGEIGELRHMTSNRLNPGAIRTEENALWSMGPHDFSMILGLANAEPVSVSSLAVRVVDPQIPDQYSVQMRFSERLTAQTSLSWISPFKEHKLTVLGTTGALVFEDTASERAHKLRIYRDYVDVSGSAPQFIKSSGEAVDFPQGEPLEAEMRAFLATARGETGCVTGPEEAIRVLRLLHRAEASTVAGR